MTETTAESHDLKDKPPSTDVVELVVLNGEKVVLFCLICGRHIGEDVNYLNEAIKVWNDHAEEMRDKTKGVRV